MPPCGHCNRLKTLCKVDVRSGGCCACIRRGLECDLRLTHEEWSRFKREKAELEQALERNEHKKQSAMTEILRLRRKLGSSTVQKAKFLEQRLAATVEAKDMLEDDPILDRAFFPTLDTSHEQQMRPQEWALLEQLPVQYWAPPDASLTFDEEMIVGEFDGV